MRTAKSIRAVLKFNGLGLQESPTGVSLSISSFSAFHWWLTERFFNDNEQ